MDKNDLKQPKKLEFVVPKAEIVALGKEDVIKTSPIGGGFYGAWDEEEE